MIFMCDSRGVRFSRTYYLRKDVISRTFEVFQRITSVSKPNSIVDQRRKLCLFRRVIRTKVDIINGYIIKKEKGYSILLFKF